MPQEPQTHIIDISWTALFKVLGLAAGLWLVVTLREIFLIMVMVFIFVAAVNPLVSRFEKRMSRPLAVTLFYAIVLAVLALISYSFVPLLTRQLNDLTHNLPTIVENVRPLIGGLQVGDTSLFDQVVSSVTSGLNNFSKILYDNTVSFVGALVTIVTTLVISFYILLEEKNAKQFFTQVLPRHRFEAVYETVRKIADRMGSWLRGQAILMLIIGAANLLVYLLIGLQSPLPLAIWAGLCEAIPYVGPYLGLLPALIVAISTGSILQVVLVIVLGLVVIQVLEGNILVPKVMGKAVGLSPVLVILSLLAGFKLFGVAGAVLGIPAAAAIAVIVEEWPNLRKLWE